MKNSTVEFYRILNWTDDLLKLINQSFKKAPPQGLIGRIFRWWPMVYCSFWLALYVFLAAAEFVDMGIFSEQMWCACSMIQVVSKLINVFVWPGRVEKLLRWCEENYTTEFKAEYQPIVDRSLEKLNLFMMRCIKIYTYVVAGSALYYLLKPLFLAPRMTPTPMALNGNLYHSKALYLTIYFGQILHAFCVVPSLSGYESVFILSVMTLSNRFAIFSQLLSLLSDCTKKSPEEQKVVLVDIYKMHVDLLETVDLFRDYYSFYGLMILGSNLIANCTILYILQTVAFDLSIFMVLIVSSVQALIVCAFGQNLQDKAAKYLDSLSQVDTVNMSEGNKRILLILMQGSLRKVAVTAGGTYELNFSLFASIMKGGFTLCAVMQTA